MFDFLLIILGLEAKIYPETFYQKYESPIRTIEILLKYPYFQKIHIGLRQCLLDPDHSIPTIATWQCLDHPIIQQNNAYYLVGFHPYIEDIGIQLRAKYPQKPIVIIKNAILTPPQGLNINTLLSNQIELELI